MNRPLNSRETLIKGIIVRAYGGYYYVQDDGREWECLLRGRFRHEKQQVLVGDKVEFRPGREKNGVIERVLPRRSALVRPPVANVDQAVIVFAVKEPDPSPALLDRFLITADMNKIEPLICFNKVDLSPDGRVDLLPRYKENYPVFLTSAKTGQGLEQLRQSLYGRVSVFAGPSGVGKSTIINSLLPGLRLKTGEISKKIGRGKHTTRRVELITLPGGGLVADTPGFSTLDLPDMEPVELASYFPEFDTYLEGCRFTGCLHYKEPGCAVKEAVLLGEIENSRYKQYIEFLEDLINRRRY